ncbi:MAG: ATP-binding cassette domain-containing protein, partial [Pseudomonadota bacterium]
MQSLKIENLSVHSIFPKLKFNLSIQLNAGEIIGLTGPSGSGKSVLFKAIADLMEHQGTITLDGLDKNSFSAPQWRKKVMLVPAESQWWFDSVGEHFPLLDKKLLDNNMLSQLDLSPSIFSQQVHEISSGEKQRLSILRAIQYQPEVLLLD